MIENIAVKIVRKMQQENYLNSQMEEHNIYAMITLTEKWLTIISIMILASAFRKIVPTVFFLIFFFALRKRTGGYHAPKFWLCYIESNAVYVGIVGLCSLFTESRVVMYALLILAACIILCIGTINHPNMDMNEKELQESKVMARYVLMIELMVIAAFTYVKADSRVLSFMAAAVILCALLLCLAKVLKQEI